MMKLEGNVMKDKRVHDLYSFLSKQNIQQHQQIEKEQEQDG